MEISRIVADLELDAADGFEVFVEFFGVGAAEVAGKGFGVTGDFAVDDVDAGSAVSFGFEGELGAEIDDATAGHETRIADLQLRSRKRFDLE